MDALEDCFYSLPGSVAEQRRQKDLIWYATVPSLLPALIPPSKFNAIEEQLRPLCKEQELPLPANHVQVCEDVFRLLEDLREAILSHQVRSRPRTRRLSHH